VTNTNSAASKLLETSPTCKTTSILWGLLPVLVIMIGMTLFQTSDSGFHSAQIPSVTTQSPDAATQSGKVNDTLSRNKKLVSQRLIPDQKAMLGALPTTMDLAPLFELTELGETGEPITVEILRAKKDVAELTLDGQVLTIDWKTKTGKKRDVLIKASVPSGRSVVTKFYVELWEPDYWKLILTVVGGLGIFLLGMNNMSQGLQAIAGNELRKMIGWVTDNRIMATAVGTLITTLVQSSSITTVTVVGFVNSGFMTLRQSLGVIMGANIGTTITGWILVLKIGKYGLPIAGVAAFFYLFSKRDRVRYFAMAVMGLGLIFFGLELMKDGFSIVKEFPAFEEWFQAFRADSYIGVLKCALVGCVLTFLVQSSSATLGITIGLAQLGVIEFETAAALVLGENIGTTITAWLASFGTTTNAKRAAYFHCIFNILGVLWITAIFHWYLLLIRQVVVGDISTPLTIDATSAATVTAGIAATHTIFNIANTILFMPLTGYMADMLERLVPDKSKLEEQHRLTSLDIRMLESPAIAIEQTRNEVINMANNCQEMMTQMLSIEQAGTWDENVAEKIVQLEERQDEMQVEFVQFMSHLFGSDVPHNVVWEARDQLRLVDEYESISDCIASGFKSKRLLTKRDLEMPEAERQEILELHQTVSGYMAVVNRAYNENNIDLLDGAITAGEEITKQAKVLSKSLLKRMPDDRLSPFVSTSYSRQVSAYRRVRDHLVNIIEVLKGEK